MNIKKKNQNPVLPITREEWDEQDVLNEIITQLVDICLRYLDRRGASRGENK